MKRLWKQLPRSLRNALRAGLATAAFTFVVLFGGSLVGWLDQVVEWAETEGASFPTLSVLGRAAVSAAAAAGAGAVNTVVRWAQGAKGRGHPPDYGEED